MTRRDLLARAGGGFGRVLDVAEVDTAIAQAMGGLRLSPLVMGWVIASLLRLSVGSATVAVITATESGGRGTMRAEVASNEHRWLRRLSTWR